MEPPSRRWAETQCCGSGSGGKSFRIRATIRSRSWAIPCAGDPPKLIWNGTTSTQSTVSYPLAETQYFGSGSGKNDSGSGQLRIQNEFEIELPSRRYPPLCYRSESGKNNSGSGQLPSRSWAIPCVVDPPKLIWNGTAQSTVSYPLAKTQCCGSGSGGKSFRIRATTQSKLSYGIPCVVDPPKLI